MKNITPKEIIQSIKDSQNIIITTHTNPDGDALGSLLGLYHLIKNNFKKKAKLMIDSSIPENLMFMKGSNLVERYDDHDDSDILNADLIIILDLNNLSRLKVMGDIYGMSGANKIVIDHHIDPKEFADGYYVDTKATSTGELIWKIANETNLKFDNASAEAVYTAIMTDTGSFRFERTNEETHLITADLIKNGANPTKCYDEIYNRKSFESMKLLGKAISDMEVFHDGKMSIMTILDRYFNETGAGEDDTEGFVANTLSIDGVEIGVMITQVKIRNEARVSFRSKGNYSVRDIALKFGGGGHEFAAGARITGGDIDQIKERIVDAAESILNRERSVK